MIESDIVLKSKDGAVIYGALARPEKEARRVIVHLHGLTHSHRHYLEMNAASYFPQHGFAHLRFSFYGREPDARRLSTIRLGDHLADLEAVLSYAQENFDEIYLIGHSFGGLVALLHNPEGIKAMSFWDPSFDVTHFWEASGTLSDSPSGQFHHLDYGNVYVLGRPFVRDIADVPHRVCLDKAASFSAPVQLVVPEQSIFLASPHSRPEDYVDAFPEGSELVQMPNANHTFTMQGNAQKLFEETVKFFVDAA